MAYPILVKEKAEKLRVQGFSLNQIHREMGISKSVLSGWLREVPLSVEGKKRLQSTITHGQFVAAERKKQRTTLLLKTYLNEAQKELSNFRIDRNSAKLLAALIYWCEGEKNILRAVNFTNSDPDLINTFLKLLRRAFSLDETKFRICLHLHSYHSESEMKTFWSDRTGIPQTQFMKSFQKINGGKRIRNGYNGCVSIRYHETAIARKLLMTAKAFFAK